MEQAEARLWLIEKLRNENPAYKRVPTPSDEQGQKDLLRMLMNVRMPRPIGTEYREVQDAYLRREALIKGIVEVRSLEPCSSDERLYLWQGDITRLAADAIVNAANSGMTGCYVPLHNCIDNCIHSAAGLDLRWKCYEIMQKQGYEEPTGQAKMTPGYCLPAKYVLHTVGPIANGFPTKEHEELLASSYKSCLDTAAQNGLESVAFCCISTGVFGYPADQAAVTAVTTVREWLDSHEGSVKKVIFNVFSDRDREIYEEILGC